MCKRSEFRRLQEKLDNNGRTALETLLTIKLSGVKEGENTFNERLLHARHTATFHYDEERFKLILETWLRTRAPDEKSNLIDVSDDRLSGRLSYYVIADQVRADVSFGLRNPKQLEEMQEMLAFTRSLSAFLHSIFQTYLTDRKLETEFAEVNQ